MKVLAGQIHDCAQVLADASASDITFHATRPAPEAEPVPEPVA